MKKRKRKVEKPRPAPVLVSSDELCKYLCGIAAFSLHDNPSAQAVVYAAVRQLQLLDAEAIKAGILRATT
jgi:hypothetical protein